MRGKAFTGFVSLSDHRITPAYAGKSFIHTRHFSLNQDHPRVCGEKSMTAFSSSVISGSPPRMRGKVFVALIVVVSIRITPAYAGKS